MTDTLSLRGLVPACPTPLMVNGNCDKAGMKALIDYMIEHGVNGVVPLGGTGEFTALRHSVRIQALEATVAAAAGRVPVVAGVLCPGIGDAIETGRDFKAAGADALMIIAPFYSNTDQQGVIAYYRAFREAVDLPIVLYDNPARSRIVLTPDTIVTLANEGTVIGMKASNTDLYHFDNVMERVSPDFQMLSGQDTLFTQQVSQGARGGVLTSAVLVPGAWNEVQALAEAGKFKEALALQRKLGPLMDALFIQEFPATVRYALDLIDLAGGAPLLPVAQVPEAHKQVLFDVMSKLHAEGILPVKPARKERG
ncbi:dihydrodipicolinate synthase family protein [Ochrobactrum soli]|uniref:Dihydrodipicolinate synthase family protein n=1 Tax=Ochrobactrum soli TaxID=2448455 RepID=A0A849KNK8_9HYPH|nr:dihydrodipicolinate synthase family protein [[Ochrobactrum] soli]NNU63485.1 dihydrodipicolinate synthase family protein [[Ochrobactrum] soli]